MNVDQFWEIVQRARDLRNAAYWMHGGCGDDGFWDFTSCLISLGRETFERCVANADEVVTLVDRDDIPFMLSEGYQYVAQRVYEEKTGDDDMPLEVERSPTLAGDAWDVTDEAERRRRLPRLSARLAEAGGA